MVSNVRTNVTVCQMDNAIIRLVLAIVKRSTLVPNVVIVSITANFVARSEFFRSRGMRVHNCYIGIKFANRSLQSIFSLHISIFRQFEK
jgi:nitrous oxidase accessory protein NosD